MPSSSPDAPCPPDLTPAQYHLLWRVVQLGHHPIITHEAAQEPRIQGLLSLGYLEATPKCPTPEARAQCQARLEACYDQLAALSRDDWVEHFDEAERLVQQARWCLRDLVESTYDVTDAGYALVRAWEEGGREQACAIEGSTL